LLQRSYGVIPRRGDVTLGPFSGGLQKEF
jgi:hypothetical protein